jgi:hypothetical protein
VGPAPAGPCPGRSHPVGRRRPLLRHSRRDPPGTRSDAPRPPDKRAAGAHDGRLLLAVERTGPRRRQELRPPRRRREPASVGLEAAMERARGPLRRRLPLEESLGHGPGRIHPGGMHLHRPGLRIRLQRRHLRSRPRMARRRMGRRQKVQQGHRRGSRPRARVCPT